MHKEPLPRACESSCQSNDLAPATSIVRRQTDGQTDRSGAHHPLVILVVILPVIIVSGVAQVVMIVIIRRGSDRSEVRARFDLIAAQSIKISFIFG